MKIPSFRRLFTTDYAEDEKQLVEKLSGPINSGIEVLYEALNNKLDFRNNFQASVRDVTVEMGINGIPKNTPIFTLINSNRIDGVLVLKLENLTNSSIYPTSAPFVSFTQSNDRIIINHITGLTADNEYSIRVVAV